MAKVRPGYTAVTLVCPVCQEPFEKELAEANRCEKRGSAQLCSRTCQATYINKTPAKLAHTKAMLAKRNSEQWRENNPHWKGGRSKRLKPLPRTLCQLQTNLPPKQSGH